MLVPSARYWEKANEEPINPPLIRKMPGRPRKVRKRAPSEPTKGQISTKEGLIVHCKKCFKPWTQFKKLQESNPSKFQILQGIIFLCMASTLLYY